MTLAMSPSMVTAITSCALFGIDAFAVFVEVDVTGGCLPGYHVVGLPSTPVKEGVVRIRSALAHVGEKMPNKKVTVNLAPADRPKQGAAFDLPIAVGVLVADGRAALGCLEGLLLAGELGLDGSLRPVRGALSAVLLARSRGMRGLLLPPDSASEAAVIDDVDVFEASHLGEVIAAMRSEAPLRRARPRAPATACAAPQPLDMSEVRGQHLARTALEVAVAGGHNILLVGPPGIGKTMLARRVPTILPPINRDEALETTKIYSAVGLAPGGLVDKRPFRAPHHSTTPQALLGGGSPPRPGEISLAHHGVLFLDELPEFPRAAVEALRQPLEDRTITIGRVHGTVTLPASFFLVASANPCPCGWLGSGERSCRCSHAAIERYRHKLSGPLLDRMDLQVFVRNVGLGELRATGAAESSVTMRERVVRARALQRERLAPFGLRTNAAMGPSALRALCPLTAKAEAALARLHRLRRGMTARSVARLIQVARTIADLEGADVIDADFLCEAASYRALDCEWNADASGSFAPHSGERSWPTSAASRQSAKRSTSTT